MIEVVQKNSVIHPTVYKEQQARVAGQDTSDKLHSRFPLQLKFLLAALDFF